MIADRFDATENQVDELKAVRAAVRLPALLALVDVDLVVQRVHGDSLPGQVLRSARWLDHHRLRGRRRSLDERRRPDSVRRDVAGSACSTTYAAHTLIPLRPRRPPGRPASKALLAGYCEEAASDRPVLDAYVLDKAVYEVVYETRNRPKWVHIPLGAVQGRTTLNPTHDSKEN